MSGCAAFKGLPKNPVAGTHWKYTDSDWSYEIDFLANGHLTSTHPNENLLNYDTWQQHGKRLRFQFNDGYSKYKGRMISPTEIKGFAHSKSGRWKWSMTLME